MKEQQSTLQSFVKGASSSFFPIQNLPYGVFTRKNETEAHIGAAISDHVLDLTILEKEKLLNTGLGFTLFDHGTLNFFASQGERAWTMVRKRAQTLLSADNDELQNNASLLKRALVPQNEIVMQMPFNIAGYSDFYASEHHATNVGKLFRGNESPLLPNWKYLPVGYNGRASTIFLSGTPIKRPKGQIKLPEQTAPIFSPSKKLDFELEIGIFVGPGNPDGQRIHINDARSHIFGLVLLNDWSARDIQAFEYQPLGPFLSKSFATSISPWVVPLAALKDFMQPLPKQVPETVEYLKGHLQKLPDLKLKVELQPKGHSTKTTVCETNFTELYWSMEQMLAHHTVNHCIMKPGDLLGSGTISGPARENWGSLLEIAFNGTRPIKLNDGQERAFLEDGDTVTFIGIAETGDYKIGFGSLEGTIVAAVEQ